MTKQDDDVKRRYPEGDVPKVTRIENASNVLVIEFDNGETRYLKSHYAKDLVDAYSPTKGKGKRSLLMAFGSSNWIGTEIEITEEGSVILNGKDVYSPEELWYDSKSHISEL
jgi:hypothetical protein